MQAKAFVQIRGSVYHPLQSRAPAKGGMVLCCQFAVFVSIGQPDGSILMHIPCSCHPHILSGVFPTQYTVTSFSHGYLQLGSLTRTQFDRQQRW